MSNNKSKLKMLFESEDISKVKKTPPTKPFFPSNTKSNDFNGLKNYGNTCFVNVIMQSIVNNIDFYNSLEKEYNKLEKLDLNIIESKYTAIYNIYNAMNFYLNKNPSLSSVYLQTLSVLFDPFQKQNDSHEFLSFLLNKLHEEFVLLNSKEKKIMNDENDNENDKWEEVNMYGKRLKVINNKNEYENSIIRNYFGGILKQEVCKKGTSVSETKIEPFFIVNLDSKEGSIEGNIDFFFNKKLVDSNDSIKLKSYLETLPKIFVFQLKAYYFDKNTNSVNKDRKLQIFQNTFIIKENWISPSQKDKLKNTKYELYSIVVHQGKSLSEGHYVCFCKDNKNNNSQAWLYINDKNIKEVSFDEVVCHRPYIMFYKRIN